MTLTIAVQTFLLLMNIVVAAVFGLFQGFVFCVVVIIIVFVQPSAVQWYWPW